MHTDTQSTHVKHLNPDARRIYPTAPTPNKHMVVRHPCLLTSACVCIYKPYLHCAHTVIQGAHVPVKMGKWTTMWVHASTCTCMGTRVFTSPQFHMRMHTNSCPRVCALLKFPTLNRSISCNICASMHCRERGGCRKTALQDHVEKLAGFQALQRRVEGMGVVKQWTGRGQRMRWVSEGEEMTPEVTRLQLESKIDQGFYTGAPRLIDTRAIHSQTRLNKNCLASPIGQSTVLSCVLKSFKHQQK